MLIKERMDEIYKNGIQQPPRFRSCKDEPEDNLQSCFENTITQHISKHLSIYTLKTTNPINDTIWLPLLISNKGKITLEHTNIPEMLKEQIPDFRTIIEQSIQSLPPVEPAHTQSTEVSTLYKVPLVIKID